MRIAIVGAGVAGALLALRLRQAPQIVVDVFAGDLPTHADATGASGGLVRGYEPDIGLTHLATDSLAELRASATLREWSDYREVGSVYLLAGGTDPSASVETVDHKLPGSATVMSRRELTAAFPFRDLPDTTIGVVERHAGYLSPARLRAAVLAELAARGTRVRRHRVDAVTAGPEGPAVRASGAGRIRYDVVVVAAGAWTRRLLLGSGLGDGGLRTKQIQYSLPRFPNGAPAGLGAFVDDTTGLYGRPDGPGSFLLGLPCDRWDVEPDAVVPDLALAGQVAAHAHRRFDTLIAPGLAERTVASFDCYHDPPGLALRPCDTTASLYTFTGGSGGAAKTVLATSRTAATTVLRG
jgi:glycine/D-amino acid oxidase-like deaminating enzyme